MKQLPTVEIAEPSVDSARKVFTQLKTRLEGGQ